MVGGDGERAGDCLTVQDVCDIAYSVLLGRVERQALADQQAYAIYAASGRYEMHEEPRTVSEAQQQLDELLNAEFERVNVNPRQRELLELMGVA